MRRILPHVDIVLDILKAVVEAQPRSGFAQSILLQYQERGGLSKKQLQGLYGMAQKITSVTPAKLATLAAIILKKPTKERTPAPLTASSVYQKDETAGKTIAAILEKYPQHKRVLFLRSRYDNNETLSAAEMRELEKFKKLIV
jgi:hypothetical protein